MYDDQLSMDGRESVEYQSTRKAGGVTVTLPNAIQYPITTRELAASGGRYTGSDVVWSLRLAELGDVTPKPADTIIDATAAVWTVLDVAVSRFAGFAKATCRNLAVAFGLEDAVDIEVPTVAAGDTGGRANVWAAKYSDLACRMQPDATESFDARGKDATARRYLCYVARQIDPRSDAGDWGRVTFEGRYYQITGYRQAERIDELPVVECVLNP